MRAHNRRFTEEQEANIRNLYLGGMSCSGIARQIGCPVKTITRVCDSVMGQNGNSRLDYLASFHRGQAKRRVSTELVDPEWDDLSL